MGDRYRVVAERSVRFQFLDHVFVADGDRLVLRVELGGEAFARKVVDLLNAQAEGKLCQLIGRYERPEFSIEVDDPEPTTPVAALTWETPVAVPESLPGLTAEDVEEWETCCRPVVLGELT